MKRVKSVNLSRFKWGKKIKPRCAVNFRGDVIQNGWKKEREMKKREEWKYEEPIKM